MAPLVIEGETLGQRHRHYNELVKSAIADDTAELAPLNYDDPDVDNLLRIDVACSRRNVDYVLDVLQCDDMLYVSRAIKRSTWLITDDQYAHIINPQHLYNELFPKMTARAQNKLILAIRLNLKNESRVEEFYNYYSNDLNIAQKWLPHCSSALIEKVFNDHLSDITSNVFKRQCEKSIDVLKALIKMKDQYYSYFADKLAVSKILLHKYPEEYLDMMLNFNSYSIPDFGIHATQQIMKKCPDKLINNFRKFRRSIHLTTFARCLKKGDIRGFLLKQAEDKKMKDWMKYDNIKHFIKYLPIENRFEFAKRLFVDKEIESEVAEPQVSKLRMAMPCATKVMYSGDCAGQTSSNAHIYRWYQFAPFDTAFTELKKLIRVESSPLERNAMLTVLINCARKKPQQVQTLLKFYREKHMNEPFKFKIQFVNTLLSLVATHKFDANTWGILNEIFLSMEVFIESENSVPYCVNAIIVYKLLHNEEIPDIIVKKHTFDIFADYRKKLDNLEGDKVFTYLYKLEMKKLNEQTTNNEVEMAAAFDLLTNVLNLLKEWKKNISDYPEILDKIRNFIKTKKENPNLKNNLSPIFDVEKKWRRHFFEESLALAPSDNACVHALRHDPGLLLRCSADVAELRSNDAISLKQTLMKLRIFGAQTLAEKWIEAYLEALDKPTGHKANTEGICILMPRKRFLCLLNKYAPVETKIDWSNTDSTLLSLQKNIAKRMKLVRPSLKLDAALSFAKEDYLQFSLPSLMALMYNMSATEVSEYVPLLFNSPVSLKKHGLRLAYSKLKFSEINDLVVNMWKNTNNSSIKTVLFKETFILLKKEKKESSIKDLWELLNMFIQNLSPDENRIIYNTLGKAADVPLIVRPQFFMKSYTYLKSLPAKANCDGVLQTLDRHASEIMELLEPKFVEDILLPPIDELVSLMTAKTDNQSYSDLNNKIDVLGSYIICNENAETSYAKYVKYYVPILDGCFESWKILKHGRYPVRDNFSLLLRTLLFKIKSWILKNQTLHVIYRDIFIDIGKRLRSALPIEENYRLITYWSIAEAFVASFSENLKGPNKTDDSEKAADAEHTSSYRGRVQKKEDEKWEEICTSVGPSIGKACLEYYLKQDVSIQPNSVSSLFVRSMTDVFDQVEFQYVARLETLKHMLDVDVPVSYLMVLEATQSLYCIQEAKQLKLRRNIYDIIKSHPSKDVKIHYYDIINNDPQIEEGIPYDADDNGMLR